MGQSKVLSNRWSKTHGALLRVQRIFENEGFDAQLLTFDDELILQVRDSTVSDNSNGPIKWLCKATGSAAVATLKAKRVGGSDVEIESAGGKWLDKAAVMGVSMVVLWPLFVTSGIGMLRQNKLIERLFNETIKALAN